jgi:hypothetical protein
MTDDAITQTERWAVDMRGRVADMRDSLRFEAAHADDVYGAARERGVSTLHSRSAMNALIEARADLAKHFREAEDDLVRIRRLVVKAAERAEENMRARR